MKTFLKIFTLLFGVFSFAQTTVTGTINDESGLPLPGANIIVVGTSSGAISDFDGKFSLTVNQEPPFTVQISSVGFTSANEEITSNIEWFLFLLFTVSRASIGSVFGLDQASPDIRGHQSV